MAKRRAEFTDHPVEPDTYYVVLRRVAPLVRLHLENQARRVELSAMDAAPRPGHPLPRQYQPPADIELAANAYLQGVVDAAIMLQKRNTTPA